MPAAIVDKSMAVPDADSQFGIRTATITYTDINGSESESVTASLSVAFQRGFVINGETADDLVYILNHSLCQWFYPLLWQNQHLTQAQHPILIYRLLHSSQHRLIRCFYQHQYS
jgi:hypothetical protein